MKNHFLQAFAVCEAPGRCSGKQVDNHSYAYLYLHTFGRPLFLNLVSEDHATTVTLNCEIKACPLTLHSLLGLPSLSVRNFRGSGLEETVGTLLKAMSLKSPGVKKHSEPR